jgi:hypothetical protein
MKRLQIAAALAAITALSACAGTPPPQAEVAAARGMIEQAAPTAARYAPEELRDAQAKLGAAEAAMAREENEKARRLAEQAAVDARLALAAANNERMAAAVAEVNEGVRTLREQLQRREQ